MKRMVSVFACILTVIVFFSSASAINRSPKRSDSTDKKKTILLRDVDEKEMSSREKRRTGTVSRTDDQRKKGQAEGGTQIREKPKIFFDDSKGKEKYDYFIDNNSNGIDDRLEVKAIERQADREEGSEEKDRANSERTPAKLKPVPLAPEGISLENSGQRKREVKPEKSEKKREKDRR
ncbi:MAG: hypothetical protein WCE90_01150 [Candidatus Zixiibacteriota bacterium]